MFFQQAVQDHGKGPSGRFFRRLKDEKNPSGKIGPPLRQPPGRPQETGRVDVMAAGVHSPGIPRPPGNFPFLLHGQGIHVRPEQHRPPGLFPFEESGDAGSGYEPPRNAKGIELPAHDPRRLLQVEIQFRTGVKPAADGDKFFIQYIDPIVLFFHSVHFPSAPPFYRKFAGKGKSALSMLTVPSSGSYNNPAISYTEIHPGGMKNDHQPIVPYICRSRCSSPASLLRIRGRYRPPETRGAHVSGLTGLR